MLDGVSLDQLRAFIAAVDEGSFSAGARKLRRAQSAGGVEQSLAGLAVRLAGAVGDELIRPRHPVVEPFDVATDQVSDMRLRIALA